MWKILSCGVSLVMASIRQNLLIAAFFQGKVAFHPWERIWKSWAPGKCHFFMLLVARNRCWTADRLARRGLEHPTTCPHCDEDEENINHLLAVAVMRVFSRILVLPPAKGWSTAPMSTNGR